MLSCLPFKDPAAALVWQDWSGSPNKHNCAFLHRIIILLHIGIYMKYQSKILPGPHWEFPLLQQPLTTTMKAVLALLLVCLVQISSAVRFDQKLFEIHDSDIGVQCIGQYRTISVFDDTILPAQHRVHSLLIPFCFCPGGARKYCQWGKSLAAKVIFFSP